MELDVSGVSIFAQHLCFVIVKQEILDNFSMHQQNTAGQIQQVTDPTSKLCQPLSFHFQAQLLSCLVVYFMNQIAQFQPQLNPKPWEDVFIYAKEKTKNQEPRIENKLEQTGMRLLVSMLHRVIKYQLNSHTGMSYCSLMFTSVLSDIRLLLSFILFVYQMFIRQS